MTRPVVNWVELRHAYGSAADIPALLAAAETASPSTHYTDEPWYSLWSALCHQGDVYTASFAAVPELVSIADRRQGQPGAVVDCLLLAGTIEMERHQDGSPSMPVAISQVYQEALRKGAELAALTLEEASDPDQVEMLSLSLAAFRGDIDEARRLADGEEEDEDGEE